MSKNEKLLHERLREYDGNGLFQCKDVNILALYKDEAEAIADEIERCYIPKPRFEDGEPVQFLSADVKWEWDGRYGVSSPMWIFNAISEDGIPMAADDEEIYGFAEMTEKGFVKRRCPDVPGADGEPIRVGDVLYDKEGNELRAKEVWFDDDDPDYGKPEHTVWCGEIKDGIKVVRIASDLTHTKPVLDADGVPIRVGDTVWSIDSDTEYSAKVTRVFNNSIDVLWEDGERGENLKGEWFTHNEPDSVKKLLDDMKSYTSEHFMPDSDTKKAINGWIERIAEIYSQAR